MSHDTRHTAQISSHPFLGVNMLETQLRQALKCCFRHLSSPDVSGVVQCVALCCSAVYCCVWWCVTVCCSVLQCVAECCSVLQCITVCCRVLQCAAVPCSVPCVVSNAYPCHLATIQKASRHQGGSRQQQDDDAHVTERACTREGNTGGW